jgi:hypothetical protein
VTSPCMIDFEASSLSSDSYPIEVAWSTPDGSIESHLIRPHWSWTDWDDYAEREIHHISHETLRIEGESPREVAAAMNNALAGQTVYSDAPEFDGHWLARLFEAAGLEPAFELGPVYPLFPNPISAADFSRLTTEARSRVPGQHRAAWDVQFLLELWRLSWAEATSKNERREGKT